MSALSSQTTLMEEAIQALNGEYPQDPMNDALWDLFPGFMGQPPQFRLRYNPNGTDLSPLEWWTVMRSWPRQAVMSLRSVLRRKLEARQRLELEELNRYDEARATLELQLSSQQERWRILPRPNGGSDAWGTRSQ